jgi:hypothetical protein
VSRENVFVLLGFLFFGALALSFTRWQLRRGREMLVSWCRRSGLEIASCEHRLLFRGPYFWASKGQVVFRFSARDTAGRLRSGFARCGGFWLGLFTEQVDVRWDA